MGWADLRRALRSGLARLIAGVAVVGGERVDLFADDHPARAGSEVIALEGAQFVADGSAPRAVLLPHTWARDGLEHGASALPLRVPSRAHAQATLGFRRRACRRAIWCA